MLRAINRYATLALAAGFFTVACSDDDNIPEPELPTTYNFENVDYSGQLQRIQMLDMLVAKIRSTHDGQTVVTASELEGIYKNSNKDLFGTDKDIFSKVAPGDADVFLEYFQQTEALSKERNLLGQNPNIMGGRLISPEGQEPAQLVAKGLMGALLYYQAVSTNGYLGTTKMSADNNTVEPGKGTALQHHWDEAFGYFGAPENYLVTYGKDATTPETKAWFWAGYANEMATLGVDVRADIFNAFIKGRDAINRKDMAARNEAIATIRENWDLLAAAATMHYIKSSLADITAGNNAALYHHWSEGRGFAQALKYNPDSKIGNQHTQLMTLLGNAPANDASLKEHLEAAYELMQATYQFSPEQLSKL